LAGRTLEANLNVIPRSSTVNIEYVSVNQASVVTGTLLGGSVASLASNNQSPYAVLNTEFDTDGEVILKGNAALRTANRIDFITDTSVSRPNIVGFYSLFDHVANDWEMMEIADEYESDFTRIQTITSNPARFIKQSDGTMRAQIRWAPTESFLDAPDWVFFIDEARWIVFWAP
jgi:hypothetical protein